MRETVDDQQERALLAHIAAGDEDALHEIYMWDLTMATPTRGWAIDNVSAQTDIGSVPVGHLVLLDGASWLPVTEHQV